MFNRPYGLVCALMMGIAAQGCTEKTETQDPNTNQPNNNTGNNNTGNNNNGNNNNGNNNSMAGLPDAVTMVAQGGFENPGDAVTSHDGTTFFFTAYVEEEDESMPAIMRVDATGGTATSIQSGAPLAHPTGMVLSCDGSTLYVADNQYEDPTLEEDDDVEDDQGALFTVSTTDGAISRITADAIQTPSGLALSTDCNTLYVTGFTSEGQPALFSLPTTGGSIRTILAGEPLMAPTGIHVDASNVSWVLDHVAAGENGPGILWAIDDQGQATEVVDDLALGTPGGVSLDSTGSTAYIPTLDAEGNGQIITVRISDGERNVIAAPDMVDPAGIRTARDAAVFVVADSEGNAIYTIQ